MNEKFIRGNGGKFNLSSMIKTFLIILGVFGLFNSSNVNAITLDNETTSNDATVSVGEVETPIFEVEIVWGDLTFNWVYDSETNEYVWLPNARCLSTDVSEESFSSSDDIYYTDSSCSTIASTYTEDAVYYTKIQSETVRINISDKSTGTQIVPSIKWNPSSDYLYVDKKIVVSDLQCFVIDNEQLYGEARSLTLYSDASCSNETFAGTYEDGKYYFLAYNDRILTTEEIPDTVRQATGGIYSELTGGFKVYATSGPKTKYVLSFSLINTTVPETAPTTGDTIGTITISIRAK